MQQFGAPPQYNNAQQCATPPQYNNAQPQYNQDHSIIHHAEIIKETKEASEEEVMEEEDLEEVEDQ
jgi:hypothetical protein